MSREIFYGWRVVAAAFLITFYVVGAIAFSFTAFIDPIAKEFGWSYTHISFAASLRGLELGVFAPVMGFLVDRFGPRRLVMTGSIFICLGFLLLSTIQTLGMFYVGFIILGVGTSTCTVTVLTPAVANWFKKDIGKALGIMLSGAGAGGALIPVVTGLIDRFGWRTAFIILGLCMLLFGIPLARILGRRPEQYGQLADGEKQDSSHLAQRQPDGDVSLGSALRTRVFWHLSLAESLRLMALMALITHVIPYLNSIGVSRTRATFVATSIPILSITGRLLAGWCGDKYNKFHVMAVLYFLGGLSVLMFAYVETEWLLYPFLFLFPLSWGAPSLQGAILRERFGRAALGSIIGLLGGIITLPRMIGPALAGWTYDIYGNYHFAWMFFAGIFAISVVLMLTVESRRNAPGPMRS